MKQQDLFPEDLPPSKPDQRPMTEEEIEQWMRDLPF